MDIKKVEKLLEWFDALPQFYDEGFTDIGKGDKTWNMYWKNIRELEREVLGKEIGGKD